MITILSAYPNGPGYAGYVKQGNTYSKFNIDSSGVNFRKIEGSFRDYEHFAGVMGKFVPWVFFLKTPIEAEELTLELLEELNLNCLSLG